MQPGDLPPTEGAGRNVSVASRCSRPTSLPIGMHSPWDVPQPPSGSIPAYADDPQVHHGRSTSRKTNPGRAYWRTLYRGTNEGVTVEQGSERVKRGLADMLKGGVIMDVTTADQAKIAEDAGAVSVMALERVPADIRKEGGVARMADATK